MSKPSFYISSPFNTFSGYGARARDIIKSIVELDKYDVKLLSQRWGDCTSGFCNDHPEFDFLNKLSVPGIPKGVQADIWMQITIPSEFQPIGKYNIGCTAGIESTGCDGSWVEGLNKMNMNWVSSQHSKSVFENVTFDKRDNNTKQVIGQIKSTKPIHVVFEGADLDVYKYLPPNEVKLDLSEIKESFCYLFVGMWMAGDMGHDRKNIGQTISIFLETFKNKKNPPALILKTSEGVENYISTDNILGKIKAIRNKIKNANSLPNVYLLNGDFNNSEINELYNHPKVKAMVSFTKGEGFGRPLLEFGLSKKPIIASNWSGQLDFLNPDYTVLIPGKLEPVHKSAANKFLLPQTSWFAPDVHQINRVFKNSFEKYKTLIVKAKQQGHYVKTNFSYSHMKELVGNILDKNIPEFAKEMNLTMPTDIKFNTDVQLPKIK